MSENLGRVFGGFLVLAVLWILVYWWWDPQPRISFDPGAAEAGAEMGRPPSAAAPNLIVEPRRVDPVIGAQATPPKPVIVPPRFRDYTVRNGDTLNSIARRELGSANLRDAVSRANPLVNFDGIKAGRVIRIPLDPTNIQGKPAADTTPAPTVTPPEQTIEYTVRSGDTLSGIAKSQYGSTAYKDLIFQANRDRLKDEDSLQLGQKLRLPPKPRP